MNIRRMTYTELIRAIAHLREEGLSWADIAFALDHEGYRREGGRTWTGPTVRHLHSGATVRTGYVPRRRGRPPKG